MNTDSQAIVKAKVLLGITGTSQDAALTIYGTIAENDAMKSTRNILSVFDYDMLSLMIQYIYNANSHDGLSSMSIAGVSESYATSYPEYIQRALRGYNLTRFI